MVEEILAMKDVTFQYDKHNTPLFKGLSLSVSRGAFVAVLGRSGSGKTTLLNLMAGYLFPREGKCLFQGEVIHGAAPTRVPIFQEDGLWPWLDVVENVTLNNLLTKGRGFARSGEPEARRLLKDVGLPKETHGRYPKELSTGMKKRVEISRAIFTKPDVILADESFANLDPETREELHRLMLRKWKEMLFTVVFSTHSVEEALYLATKVVVLLPTLSSTQIAGTFTNPFQGDRSVQRRDPWEYYGLFDKIRAAMRGEQNDLEM